MQTIRELLTRLGGMAAHPGAFGILIGYAVLWFIFDRDSFDWHAGATLIVWFMTLLIQRAEHRDTQALQAKIDELLHANAQADSAMTKIDDNEPEDIERLRTKGRLKGLTRTPALHQRQAASVWAPKPTPRFGGSAFLEHSILSAS